MLGGELAVPCYPQAALAGLNSRSRSESREDCPRQEALKAWSCAARRCEPRQVRKEAAVSREPRVPQGHRAGAHPAGEKLADLIDSGCTAAPVASG